MGFMNTELMNEEAHKKEKTREREGEHVANKQL